MRDMTLPTCLRKVLEQRVQELQKPDGFFILREKGVMEIGVSDLADDAAIVRLSKIGELSGLKQGSWKQACDYMVVVQSRGEVQVLFVELKKTLTQKAKGIEQLRRSLRFLQYLRAVCEVECGIEFGQPEVRYALIAAQRHHRLNKQRIRTDGALERESHKGIEVALHVVDRRVAFRRLWQG